MQPLSPRQLEILCLYSQGLRSPDIAAFLYISERTIERHLADIQDRGFETRSIANSIVVAVSRGELIIEPGVAAAVIPRADLVA